VKILAIRPVPPAQVFSLCLPHRSTAIGALNEFLGMGHSGRLRDCCCFTAPPNGVDCRDFTDASLTIASPAAIERHRLSCGRAFGNNAWGRAAASCTP
jgi:hypothetical protein